jgi:hypothetical protein
VTNQGAPLDDLIGALHRVRDVVDRAGYPLAVASAGPALTLRGALLAQLDHYTLPRLAHPDTPLLTVVGGPTGAGKSTLVNSLVRAPVSATGVLRPTTRTPVFVCHPADAAWLRSGPLLAGAVPAGGTGPGRPRLVTAPALAAGCVFLDTPDIDSVVEENRAVATRLIDAADLWLFVTTAARYADAVPWQLLDAARGRGAAVAVVLNRAPPDPTGGDVTAHLTELLASHADGTPLFVLPETQVDRQGLLPETAMAPLRDWFGTLAGDAPARAGVRRRTLDGAVAATPPAMEALAVAVDDQVAAAEVLAEQVGMAYGAARAAVERGVRDGTLLAGDVAGRWREFVASGEWSRAILAPAGQVRGRLRGSPRAGGDLVTAVEAAVVSLVRSAAIEAAAQVYRSWCGHPTGAALAGGTATDLSRPSPAVTRTPGDGSDDQVVRQFREWWQELLGQADREVAGARGRGRAAARAAHATGVLLLVGVFVGGAAPLGAATDGGRQVLAAVRDHHALAGLSGKARDDLLARVGVLLDAEAARYLDRLAGVSLDGAAARRLRESAVELEGARLAAGLSGDPTAAPGDGTVEEAGGEEAR